MVYYNKEDPFYNSVLLVGFRKRKYLGYYECMVFSFLFESKCMVFSNNNFNKIFINIKYVCLSLDESHEFLTVRANIIGWDHAL